jgi:hypothetical protein
VAVMAKKNFTKQRQAIEFEIDDDVFYAHKGIPADTLIRYAAKFESLDMEKSSVMDKLDTYHDALELCLEPASFKRFVDRLSDPANPIDGDQLDEVTTWLFEQYGMRPTQPSGNSSDGLSLPETGTTSMESTQGVVLISVDSPSTSS